MDQILTTVVFFYVLHDTLYRNKNLLIICAGDWNLTYSTDPTESNIDILNMLSPPSPYRSRRLNEICEAASLVDPYQILQPRRREFTYVPRTAAKNRSRLDFFLISEKYINILDKCSISSSLITMLFDHKCVFLSLKTTLPE
jgi:exonuclease III